MIQLLLILFIGSVLVYFLTKLNKILGILVNLGLSMYAFYKLFSIKVGSSEDIFSLIPNQNGLLTYTELSKFFAVISMIVIISVSIFLINWLSKQKYPNAFNFFYMLAVASSLGVFFSGDLLTLYVFWEIMLLSSLMLVPMGKEESKRAAMNYLVVSLIGSYMYLYAAFMLWNKYGTLTIQKLIQKLLSEPSMMFKWGVVLLIAAAGIAKSGVFPLYTWLRLTHGTAPDAFSAVLSGQLVKMGSYVLALTIAVFPSLKMFPALYGGIPIFNYLLIAFGATSIIIGTLMAIKQNDMKMLIAYSTVANGGYILIGIATVDKIGFAGGLFHVFNHAIAAAMIFLSFAAVVYRTKTTKIDEMGGLIWRMPLTFITYLVGIISLAGIPPTSGFISKWMIFVVLVKKGMFITAAITFIGSVGSFLYVFRPLAGVFLGQLKSKHKDIKEVPIFMLIPMLFLVLLTLFFGVVPGPILGGITAVEKELGIVPIEHTLTIIKSSVGQWNTLTVFTMFAVGFIIAFILYIMFPKAKQIPLTDQYTAGEFLYNYDLYHYATKFYGFFERLYEKHPSFEKLYEMFGKFFKDLGEFFNRWFYAASPSAYIFWVSLITLVIFWVRW